VSSTSSDLGLYLSSNESYEETDILLGTVAGSALSPGGQSSVTKEISVPGTTNPGNYYIIFKADPTNATPESSKTNNEASKPLTITNNMPDLTISKVEIAETFFEAGKKITVKATVYNLGKLPAKSSKIRFELQKASGNNPLSIVTTYEDVITLQSETGLMIEKEIAIPSSAQIGDYYLRIVADSDDSVSENNEENNLYLFTFHIFNPLAVNNEPLTELEINAFPNPNIGEFKVEIDKIGSIENIKCVLYTSLGVKVDSRTLQNHGGSAESFYKVYTAKGAYILEIEVNKKKTFRKILVQ
jgi:trimeric autotransporter adhesin